MEKQLQVHRPPQLVTSGITPGPTPGITPGQGVLSPRDSNANTNQFNLSIQFNQCNMVQKPTKSSKNPSIFHTPTKVKRADRHDRGIRPSTTPSRKIRPTHPSNPSQPSLTPPRTPTRNTSGTSNRPGQASQIGSQTTQTNGASQNSNHSQNSNNSQSSRNCSTPPRNRTPTRSTQSSRPLKTPSRTPRAPRTPSRTPGCSLTRTPSLTPPRRDACWTFDHSYLNDAATLSAASNDHSNHYNNTYHAIHPPNTPNYDRFIPNRSQFRVDLARASMESAERNLNSTFERLTRRELLERASGSNSGEMDGMDDGNGMNGGGNGANGVGGNGNPAPVTPSTPANTNDGQSNNGVGTGGAGPTESLTPIEAEFRRRMRGALLNIPLDEANGRSFGMGGMGGMGMGGMGGRNGAGGAGGMGGGSNNSTNGSNNSLSVSDSPSLTRGLGRENSVSNVVYASIPDENDVETTNGGSRRGVQRMLSFQGNREESRSYRSMSSSSLGGSLGGSDSGMSDTASLTSMASSGMLTPHSTPMKLRRNQSTSAAYSPHRGSMPSTLTRSSSNPSSNPTPFPTPFPTQTPTIDPFSHDQLHVLHRAATTSSYSSSVHSYDSLSIAENRLRSATKSIGRRIPKTPSRILDAPELVDDYYLNLVSWGKNNVLAVALGQCVYLWEAETGNIRHLLTLRGEDDFVTSVAWCADGSGGGGSGGSGGGGGMAGGNGNYIAIGTNHNAVQLWDAEAERKLRTLDGHTARVGALSWNQHWLSSGGRDSHIIQHDVRSRNHVVSTYVGHTQEVCGLKWNDEGSTLASGGNENLLCLWDAAMSRRSNHQHLRNGHNNSLVTPTSLSHIGPRLTLHHHKAAVKALAWCPFHRGLLASGGGTADRTIKFWNTNSGAVLNSIDTGSQVCSLLWSKHQREICSSHGFSENQLILWKYPSMTKIQEFKGHTARVLHMDQSPDGGCVVSAAADETLRFWDVFGSPPSERKGNNLAMGNFCGGSTIR